MNSHDMNALIDELVATWAEVGELLEARGARLELRHHGCEGGGASLHMVDVNTGVETEVGESYDSWD